MKSYRNPLLVFILLTAILLSPSFSWSDCNSCRIDKPLFEWHSPSGVPNSCSVSLDGLSSIQILVLAEHGVGDNYFDVIRLLDQWGVGTTTVSSSHFILSCNNKGQSQIIEADLLYSDLNASTLATYDCLFVPSGGYWSGTSQNPVVQSFVKNVSDAGLFLSSMCVGTPILARASRILDGKYVLCHVNGQTVCTSEGANVVKGKTTITDGKIITGGIGGGFTGGGHSVAPYQELSLALLRNILGRSFMQNLTLKPENGVTGENYTISVVTTACPDIFDLVSEVNRTNIARVSLRLLDAAETGEDLVVSLASNHENLFSASFMLSDKRPTQYILEIETESGELEIIRGQIDPASNPSIASIPFAPFSLVLCATLAAIMTHVKRGRNFLGTNRTVAP